MKHTVAETVEVAAWLLLGIVAAFAMAAHGVGEEEAAAAQFSPGGMFVWVLFSVALGAVVVLFVLRTWDRWPTALKIATGTVGIAVMFAVWGRVMARGAYGIFSPSPPPLWTAVAFGALFLAVVMVLHKQVRQGAYDVGFSIATRLNTVLMLCALGVVSVSIAQALTPVWVVALLVVVAIYDFIAVRQLKTMQEMALGLVKTGFIPAIVIPKKVKSKKEMPMALLGGGDVFAIAVAGLVFTREFGTGGLIVTSCMYGAVVWLLFAAKPKKFYPAVPYIVGGLAVGMALMWMWSVMV